MRLSELKTGERGVIVKVIGHGGFRKRIVEMGFIKGKIVDVLQNAPLQDPVKYKVMGYEISLRRSEASMIEVISVEEARQWVDEYPESQDIDITDKYEDDSSILSDKQLHDAALKKRRTINVALIGNPNCGKTSLFNFASGSHEKVGNYSGVTVDAKEGRATFEGYEFNIIDLPGTYSLSAYSPEELYVRRQLIEKTPDVVINVIDTSNLERNLYLTTQLIDMHLRMVCALNMYDEAEKRGDIIDSNKLGTLFGIPMIPTTFTSGRGVELLFHIIINMYEGLDFLDNKGNLNPEVADEIRQWHLKYDKEDGNDHEEDFASGIKPRNNVFRHIHINHGRYIEEGIADIQKELKKPGNPRHLYSTRYLAIKLLENDKEAEKLLDSYHNKEAILKVRDRAVENVKYYTKEDCETAIMNAKYGFIHGALHESGYETGNKKDTYQTTHIIDNVITNRYVGFPIFIMFLWVMFEATFSLGQYPMDWIEAGVAWIGDTVKTYMSDGPLKDLISDGIIGGVGAVIVFLPQILILYLFISYMEDCGYMARAAFIMDKLMHKIGLHGKSFIPLIMGFGCNVPAIMATRTIESRRSRIITMLIIPLMSCSARLPIYIMITGIMFPKAYQSAVMMALYVTGIVMAILMSRLFSRFLIKDEDTPFVMELPPYRFPTSKAIARHTWEKGKQYLKKMGGIILVASIIVWALSYFPHDDRLNRQQQVENSYIGQIGKFVEPVFRPQGFDWKLDVAILSGVGAKEIVASTISILYSSEADGSAGEDTHGSEYGHLRQQMTADNITPLTAISFLVFILLYFPCIATIAAIKGETGSWKWTLFAMAYTTALAWITSAAVFQVGTLFGA